VTSGSVRLALIKRLPGILRGPVLGVIQERTLPTHVHRADSSAFGAASTSITR